MKIDIDELNAVQRKVRVELPADRVAGEFARVYKRLGQRVRVKGFRTGKIPRTVLQGIYGEEVKGEVKTHLVEESLGEIIRERGLRLVSRPEVETDDLSESDAFSFSAVFEIKPEIAVRDYIGMAVEKAKLAVSDAQVDEALDRLREAHAHLQPINDRDIVAQGDFVTLDYEGSIDGKGFPGAKGQNYALEVGSGQALPEFEEAVTGSRLNEPKIAQVRYPENYPNKEIAGKTVQFSLLAREIKHKVLPALDDEFAKDHGECDSLAELRERIRARLAEELRHYQDQELKEKIISQLIAAHPFSVPPSMVERQTRYLLERYQSQTSGQSGGDGPPPLEEARKTLEARALRQVQATLLLEKIAEMENITAADKQVQERVDALAKAAGNRAKTVREYYASAESRADLRAQIVFERTASFLLERAIVTEVDSSVSKVDEVPEKR
jgi:trigger factor